MKRPARLALGLGLLIIAAWAFYTFRPDPEPVGPPETTEAALPSADNPRPVLQRPALASPFDLHCVQLRLDELELVVQGVIGGAGGLAVVSGRTVGVGDTLGGFHVLDIDGAGLVLGTDSGIRFHLALQTQTP